MINYRDEYCLISLVRQVTDNRRRKNKSKIALFKFKNSIIPLRFFSRTIVVIILLEVPLFIFTSV